MKSKAQTQGFYNGGLYCNIPSAVSLAAIATRFEASRFIVYNRRMFPGTFGCLKIFFKSNIQAGNYAHYLALQFNLCSYFVNRRSYLSNHKPLAWSAVEIPVFENPVEFRIYFPSFRILSLRYQHSFYTNTKTYIRKVAA